MQKSIQAPNASADLEPLMRTGKSRRSRGHGAVARRTPTATSALAFPAAGANATPTILVIRL